MDLVPDDQKRCARRPWPETASAFACSCDVSRKDAYHTVRMNRKMELSDQQAGGGNGGCKLADSL